MEHVHLNLRPSSKAVFLSTLPVSDNKCLHLEIINRHLQNEALKWDFVGQSNAMAHVRHCSIAIHI